MGEACSGRCLGNVAGSGLKQVGTVGIRHHQAVLRGCCGTRLGNGRYAFCYFWRTLLATQSVKGAMFGGAEQENVPRGLFSRPRGCGLAPVGCVPTSQQEPEPPSWPGCGCDMACVPGPFHVLLPLNAIRCDRAQGLLAWPRVAQLLVASLLWVPTQPQGPHGGYDSRAVMSPQAEVPI